MPAGPKIYGETIVFGIGVEFEAEDAEALSAALALFELQPGPPEKSVYVVIAADEQTAADIHWIEGAQLRIVKDGIAISADGAAGRGRLAAPPGVPTSLFGEMMTTLVLFLVAQAERIPLHASAVMLGDTAMILAGPSGMGKSSLALAANARGLAVLSDDTVYVQTQPVLKIWALPRAIHVFERDAPAGAVGGMRYRAGRWKRALAIAVPREHAARAMLCVLARGNHVALESMREDDAVRELTSAPEPGYDLYGARAAAAVRAVAAGGCWRLTLSRNPDVAIAMLEARFGAANSLAAEGVPSGCA